MISLILKVMSTMMTKSSEVVDMPRLRQKESAAAGQQPLG
jgi:hypothetical protein